MPWQFRPHEAIPYIIDRASQILAAEASEDANTLSPSIQSSATTTDGRVSSDPSVMSEIASPRHQSKDSFADYVTPGPFERMISQRIITATSADTVTNLQSARRNFEAAKLWRPKASRKRNSGCSGSKQFAPLPINAGVFPF